MHIEGLDELDNRILDVIRENARLTYKEIGDAVGFTSPEVVTGDVLRQWKKGFYRAVLWGSDVSPVLVLEYSVA